MVALLCLGWERAIFWVVCRKQACVGRGGRPTVAWVIHRGGKGRGEGYMRLCGEVAAGVILGAGD
jgi:hypothetical protein